VPLHGHLERALLALTLEGDDLLVERLLVLVEERDEVDDAAVVLELHAPAVTALVDQRDLEPAGEEGGVAHPLLDGLEVVLEGLEDLGVGQKGGGGPGLRGLLAAREVGQGLAALVGLAPDVAITADLEIDSFREGVDHGDADSVQPAGNL